MPLGMTMPPCVPRSSWGSEGQSPGLAKLTPLQPWLWVWAPPRLPVAPSHGHGTRVGTHRRSPATGDGGDERDHGR